MEIGLKRQTNPEGKDYSVATFKRLGDFHGDQLAAVRKYALSFREQIRGMNRQRIEAKREQDDGLCEVESYAACPCGHRWQLLYRCNGEWRHAAAACVMVYEGGALCAIFR